MKQPDRVDVKKDGPHYFLGHLEVTEAGYRAVYPLPPVGEPGDCFAGNPTTGWPIISNAAGVHPAQVEQAKALDQKLGVGDTAYTKSGDPILRDRAHRKRFLKAHGMVDRASYTGY